MDDKFWKIIFYLSYFIVTGVFSFLINGLFLKFASTLGIRNPQDTVIRWSATAKPALGGISFYLIFLISIASHSIFFEKTQLIVNKPLLGILASCTLAFLMGLADDSYNTRPVLKFIIQVLCGCILIYTGTYISIFNNSYLNYTLTLFWVVGLMNSINMLDNMDGITTSVSICILFSAIILLLTNGSGSNGNIVLLIGVMAALVGFLFFNWQPAKLYMGDTGSQFLGLFLAAMGIIYFWNAPDSNGDLIPSKQFFIALLAFAIPIIDTASVTINRLLKGKSPFVGGKDHTTHSLFFMGLTEKRIAVLYIGISFGSLFLNYLIITQIENWGYLHIVLFSIYFIVLFLFLFKPVLKKGL
ncbi:MAG: MraY family glycosyltransferase [Bacteroidia bacterium]